MIQVESYNTFDKDEWRSLIANIGGNVFHLPEIWLAGNETKNIHYLILKKNKDIVGACIGICQERKFLKIFRSSYTLYLPSVPAVSITSTVNSEQIYNRLIYFSGKAGFKFLRIGLHWGADLSHDPKLNQFIDGRLIEFTVDLGKDIDTIKSSFHKKHRKNIRKASEYNIEIITDNSLDSFMILKKLQESSSAKASTKGNVYGIQSEKYFIDVHKHVYKNGLGNIMFVKKDEKYLAGLAYLFFNNKAVTVRSGVLPEGYDISAPYYLQFELIRHLRDEGYDMINIGGVPEDASNPSHPQHGLYQFKKGFGSVANLRTGLTIPLS